MRRRPATAQPAATPRITRSAVKRYVGVASVILPTVTPLVYQAASAVRDEWDRRQARRLGMPVERLGEFSGRGAALHARLAGLTDAIAELRGTHPDQAEFADTSGRRLADLAAAVRAAEQMPAPRRRAAHRAVSAELDDVETELLRRYELGRGPGPDASANAAPSPEPRSGRFGLTARFRSG